MKNYILLKCGSTVDEKTLQDLFRAGSSSEAFNKRDYNAWKREKISNGIIKKA